MQRWLNLFRKQKLNADLEEEVGFHLDQLIEKYRRAGLSEKEARLAARREFGGVEASKERYRDQRGVPYLEDFVQDLSYALRLIARSPGFTVVCVLTLALGIGANAGVFSLIHAALLKLAPYAHAEQLVEVCRLLPQRPPGGPYHNSQKYFYLKDRLPSFEYLAARKSAGDSNLITAGAVEQVHSARVSANYFDALGVKPIMGRFFTDTEDRPGGPSTAILSHSLWQRRFGGRPDILGEPVNLGGKLFEVAGILPEDFVALPPADVWTPLQARPVNDGLNTYVFGRLKPGISKEQANRELDAAVRDYYKEFAATSEMRKDESAAVAPLLSLEGRMAKTPLMLLFAAVGLVLLIACANLANLLLARATSRGREVAIRATLGAGRGRIVRQMLAECLALAGLGGAVSLVIGHWLTRALVALNPISLSSLHDVRIDPAAIGFTAALSLATGVLFGLAPALHVTRMDLSEATREGGSRASGGRRGGLLRRALVVSEVGVSTLLLIGAGLLLRTFLNLVQVDPGVDPANVVAGRMPMQGDRYDTAEKISALYRRGLERLRALPNVESAAVISDLPMERGLNLVVWVPGTKDADQPKLTDWRYCTPSFFQLIRIPLLSGRLFTDADGARAEGVAIINRRFARMYFGSENPVGRTMQIMKHSPVPDRMRTIIGVVGDAKSEDFRAEARPTVFVPVDQAPDEHVRMAHGWFQPNWIVRARGGGAGIIPAIEREIRVLDPLQPFSGFRTLEEVRSRALRTDRAMMLLLAGFASVAMLLAAAGIYGVMSYTVAQRAHEIGIRLALGATTGRMIRGVVAVGAWLGLAGVAAGTAGALALTRFMRSLVFGVEPADPATFAAAAACLVGIAALASLLPAWRIARMDPARALRAE